MIDKNAPCTDPHRASFFLCRCMTANQLNYAKFMDLVHKKISYLKLSYTCAVDSVSNNPSSRGTVLTTIKHECVKGEEEGRD